MTQIGLMFEGQFGMTWERWQRLLQAAEDFGYQCLFRSDHYTIGPPDLASLETWVSLTYAAGNTQRIEFGPLVSPTTFRHPALTARMAAAVSDLSGGRLVLGLGTGWHEREHKQYGIPFYDVPTRYAMFEDALEVTTRLYKHDGPVSYEGKHYPLDGAVLLPRPAHRIPILIGGNGMKKTLPLVAKYADEWNGVFIDPTSYRERIQRLDGLLEQNGRKQGDLKRSLMTAALYGRTDAEVKRQRDAAQNISNAWIIGTTSEVIDRIQEYVEAGMQRVMLQWQDLDDITGIEAFAKEVLPHFHK